MSGKDFFNMFGKGEIDSPASSAFAITPHNTTLFDYATRAIYVGGDGNISVLTVNGDTVTFVGCVAGTLIPIRARRVNSTGTTALNLVGLY
jgi:hypothetical protein